MAKQPDRTTRPPYPPSSIIQEITWNDEILKSGHRSGDNWPIAWVDDDLQITSYGDGGGFSDREPELTLGFARVYGDPPDHHFEDIYTNADVVAGYGRRGIKSSGMLAVEGMLYLWVRNYIPDDDPKNYEHARLAWSDDLGITWTWADWYFSQTFGCPAFVHFGKNYEGARDEYVYVISQANDDAYTYDPDVVMARVSKQRVADRASYEFYTGLDHAGDPIWASGIAKPAPIFTDPNGTQRISMTYHAPLDRYLLATSHYPPGCDMDTHSAALGIFDAPEPWGPWTTVEYDARWSDSLRTYHHRIPPKWISEDGTSFWLLYSGLDASIYDFCLKQAHLKLAP